MLLVGASPNRARAALGASADSVAADAAAFQAAGVSRVARPVLNAPALDGYAVARMTAAGGIAVTEYVGPDAKVFAVSWRGRRPPDLSVLLGSYFAQYQDAARAGGLTAHGLHHASVRGGDVAVETAGHMRDMWGRAWLPAMLPPGVEESEIR
jgi:uncharacterized protein DUF2844